MTDIEWSVKGDENNNTTTMVQADGIYTAMSPQIERYMARHDVPWYLKDRHDSIIGFLLVLLNGFTLIIFPAILIAIYPNNVVRFVDFYIGSALIVGILWVILNSINFVAIADYYD